MNNSNVNVVSEGTSQTTRVYVGGVEMLGITAINLKPLRVNAVTAVELRVEGVCLGQPETSTPEPTLSSEEINHLFFIFERMVNAHGELVSYDYMWQFKSILKKLSGVKSPAIQEKSDAQPK